MTISTIFISWSLVIDESIGVSAVSVVGDGGIYLGGVFRSNAEFFVFFL